MYDDGLQPEVSLNATRQDLEKLNGLLIKELIRKLEEGEATATDIGNAVKVVVSNRVEPIDPRVIPRSYPHRTDANFDFPVKVD